MTSSNFEDTITGCQYGIGYPQHTYAEPINIQISEMENRLKKSIRNATYKYRPRGWGRGLCRKNAARYVGLFPTKFDSLVGDGRMPKLVKIDGRVV